MYDRPKIPDWMAVIADDAKIGINEICQIYGIHKGSSTRCIKNGSIPKPDLNGVNGRMHWNMGSIRRIVNSNAEHKR